MICPSSTPWAGGPPTGTASRPAIWTVRSLTARVDQAAGDTICDFSSPDLAAWGELVSLYGHPDYWGQGYGSLIIDEVLRRLETADYPGCFLYVLRENTRARRFYEKHSFVWDGHALNVALTPESTLSDLRYRKEFHV